MTNRFWETRSLDKMSPQEWEALCDSCGHCCLVKLEEEDTGDLYITNVACRQLDLTSCSCKDYEHRTQQVATCVQLSFEELSEFTWLPDTCAYRRLWRGLPLPEWHPLITGSHLAMEKSGISICAFAQSEEFIHPDQLQDHVIEKI